MMDDETKLIEIVKNASASLFDRAKACQRLAVAGTKACVPALAGLLADERMAHYARIALEPIPDPSVDKALVAAIPKLAGRLLIGVVGSLGQRRSEAGLKAVARLLEHPDPEVACAAAYALAKIGGTDAEKALNRGLTRPQPQVRTAVVTATRELRRVG